MRVSSNMNNNYKDAYYFAGTEITDGAFDPMEGLDNGTVVLGPTEKFEDFITKWSRSELLPIAKRGKAYLAGYCQSPVTLLLRIFSRKREAMEAYSRKFDTLVEMINFMRDNPGLILMSCSEINTENFSGYILRYFGQNGNPVRINWLTYIYNKYRNKCWSK